MRISDWSSDVCSSDLETDSNGSTTASNASEDALPRQYLKVANFTHIQRSNTGDDAATMLLRGGADLALVNGIIVSPTQTCLRIDSSATVRDADTALQDAGKPVYKRSEEHTSELQSLMRISYAVFCLKKNKQITLTLI